MQKLISHRGNINGKNEIWENHPDYLEEAVAKGYDLEIDIWYSDWAIVNNRRVEHNDFKWYLGHDLPSIKIPFSFIRGLNLSGVLWCHAKTVLTMYMLHSLDIHCFFHDRDRAVFTNRGFMWTYPCARLTINSIAVLPEKAYYTNDTLKSCYGICSDYVENYRHLLRNDKC